MYRLTNTTHTEVAPSLPLPSLPVCFGAASQDLVLFEDKDNAAQKQTSNLLLSHAGKIAELLGATDISYLSIRDGSKVDIASIPAEPGSLVAAVLEYDPEAFNYTRAEQGNQQGLRQFTSERRPGPLLANAGGLPEGSALQNAHEPSVAPNSMDNMSSRRTRMRRKTSSGVVASSGNGHLDSELDAVYAGFCEVLEGIFEKIDSLDEDEVEEGGVLLPFSEIKLIADEVATAHAKNVLQLLPTANLVRLLGLLDRHVQHALNRSIDEDEDNDSENFLAISSALEAVQTSLIIMTHPGMPKQVYKEEIIDRTIGFSRYQIVYSIFTAYDPSYKQLHKGGEVEDDLEDEDLDVEGGSAKKSRRKSKGSRIKRLNANKVSVPVSSILQKLCSILGSMKELLSVERLMDSTVLQLIKTVLATFGVENIQLLQLKAIGVACTVFASYPQHRTVILDEILSLLWKLPLSKRNLRTYHLPDEEPKQIQMLTALLLQLVQCSVNLPEVCESMSTTITNSSTDANTGSTKGSDPAMEASTYFWRNVLQRWTTPKAHDGADIRALVENLILDLLTTVNAPEFPAANVLLQVLCVLLFGSAGLKSKDAAVRATAIELLGQIAARLKQDTISCSIDKLWIFQEVLDIPTQAASSKDTCVACNTGRGSKLTVSCDSCHGWFHGDCVGVTGHDFISRGWVCHCCLCKRQLVALETFLKAQAADGKLRFKNEKGAIESRAPEEVIVPKAGAAILQQMLLNYLEEAAASDTTAAYARRFYLWQWFRDDPQGDQNLPFYQGRWSEQTSPHGFGVVPTAFTRDVIVRIAAMLGQQRPLARGFDRILERLLVSLQENSPTPRAKALRAVSAIVEVDPGVLGDERVQRAVEGRFLDSAISVREAAMELVGRHITSQPDVAVKYFEKIAERIMDTGVSVRKRVIKIIRDLCISRCDFSKAADACLRILSRINDEETSIQDLVCRTFYELWFEEPANQHGPYVGDSSVPSDIAERVQQLVDVLKSLQNHQAMVIIIKRSLALDFLPQTAKNSATSLVSQATVRNRCELMCKCLIENILKADEGTSEEAESHALPYVLALHSFCVVDPTLCTPAADPSRYAVTLQPYLKTQIDSRDVAQLLQSIVFVIDTVLPLIRRPPPNFVEELEKDLRQLIVRYSFLTVVHACIKCLCSLGKVAVKGLSSFEFLVRKFYKLLDSWRQGQYGASDKPNVLRCLFCLGLLVRYGADMIDSMDDRETSTGQLLLLYKHFLLSDDLDVKVRSLQALGFFFIARPEFMMEKDMGIILEDTLASAANIRIKIQSLRNFYEYLVDVEEKMGYEEVDNDVSNKSKNESGTVPVAAGAGDSNICGGIIQLHWDSILERCLDMNDQARQAAVKVVEIVLRQGLVHPMTCVPHLIALEVDQQELNSKLAHRLLAQMNEKYPSFFESRLGDGLQLSFKFIECGAASSCQPAAAVKSLSNSKSKIEATLALSAKLGISRTYKLIRGSRVSRNKFIASVVRKFDVGTWGFSSLSFLVYCTEILASLPFTLPDEPLYLVFAINRVVQVRAGGIESNIKALISQGPLENVAKQASEVLAADRQRESENAYNLDTVQPSKNEDSCVDDTNGIPEEAVLKLKGECLAAAALALLLRLKRHVKIVYSLNDARCQSFTPTEPIKGVETLCKQTVKDFGFKEIPITASKTIKQMLAQYQAFKRLMKEDAMDYSTYTANLTRKRNRMSIPPTGLVVDASNLVVEENGHVPNLRPVRRKSAPMGTSKTRAAGDDIAGSDDDAATDEDYDVDDDDTYGSKPKKRRRSGGVGRTRSKKQPL